MTNILRIDSSLRTSDSVSRALADQIEARFTGATVTRRDLVKTPVPAIDEAWTQANFTDSDARSDQQKAALALSDNLVAELKAADIVLISTPIYNFSIPAGLKSWIDHIARARVTFRYSENGPVGLLEGKRAILALASGGTPVDAPYDYATPYLRHVMGFVGITDVDVVASDAMMANAEAAQAKAQKAIEALVLPV